jgi:hypothetical protein
LFISITKNRWFRLSAWIAGNEILPEARVLAIADIVEAMASYRPYRPALGIEKALHEIELLAGKQLDAEYVAVCADVQRGKFCITFAGSSLIGSQIQREIHAADFLPGRQIVYSIKNNFFTEHHFIESFIRATLISSGNVQSNL